MNGGICVSVGVLMGVFVFELFASILFSMVSLFLFLDVGAVVVVGSKQGLELVVCLDTSSKNGSAFYLRQLHPLEGVLESVLFVLAVAMAMG